MSFPISFVREMALYDNGYDPSSTFAGRSFQSLKIGSAEQNYMFSEGGNIGSSVM